MSLSYTIFKNSLKRSIIDSLYEDVITKTSRYYHWFGKENSWADFLSPFIPSSLEDIPGPPENNLRYDLHVRRDILTAKSVSSSDVSYVIPRYDWRDNTIYDMYDDAYNTPIEDAILWQAGLSVITNQIIKHNNIYYYVSNPGNLGIDPPVHVNGEELNGDVNLLYITRDTVAFSGATSLEEAIYYVLTSEFNVYKCIWNNNDSPSTIMPTTTTSSVFDTADGYKWKFMYSIPPALRNKFLTTEWMPVSTALKSQFFTNGEIQQVIIENPGSGYTSDDSVVVSGDGFIADNPFEIIDLLLLDEGLGYTTTPNLAISPPTVISGLEELATGTVSVNNGVVFEVSLLSTGFGYGSAPTVTIELPRSFDFLWTPNTGVNLNDIIARDVPKQSPEGISYITRVFYKALNSGTLDVNVPPVHIEGTAFNGDVELEVVARSAVAIAVIEKTEASISLLVDDGEIIGVIINDGGVGYSAANISILSSTGSGAVLVPNFSIGNVNTLQANVELFAIPGTVDAIKVVDPGQGYGTVDIEIIGDGFGATAVGVLASGSLSEIIVTNPGQGYTWTDVIITGNGTGAVARTIVSPIKGHGHNAVEEFNAKSLMFYTSFSRDINQGLIVNNDYRKVGLLRNPREFSSGSKLTSETASGCILITANFDINRLDYDMLLTKDNFKNYRIVEFTENQILLSVFNNFPLFSGDILVTEDGYSFSVDDVKERTIDQFSGDLIMLSVREPFEPRDDQIITLRTVVTI